eukprot:jgi/Ulvmu1/12280/UM087_0014.1
MCWPTPSALAACKGRQPRPICSVPCSNACRMARLRPAYIRWTVVQWWRLCDWEAVVGIGGVAVHDASATGICSMETAAAAALTDRHWRKDRGHKGIGTPEEPGHNVRG